MGPRSFCHTGKVSVLISLESLDLALFFSSFRPQWKLPQNILQPDTPVPCSHSTVYLCFFKSYYSSLLSQVSWLDLLITVASPPITVKVRKLKKSIEVVVHFSACLSPVVKISPSCFLSLHHIVYPSGTIFETFQNKYHLNERSSTLDGGQRL